MAHVGRLLDLLSRPSEERERALEKQRRLGDVLSAEIAGSHSAHMHAAYEATGWPWDCGYAGISNGSMSALARYTMDERLARILKERAYRKHQWQQIYGSIVIVAGSRTFHNDYGLFCSVMEEWKRDHGHTLDTLWTFLSGDARKGPDFLIKRYCGLVDQDGNPLVPNDINDCCQLLPALWNEYGKRAGMLRNHEMGDIATHLVAFWDKKSRGTKDMLDYARQKKLHVTEVWVNPDE